MSAVDEFVRLRDAGLAGGAPAASGYTSNQVNLSGLPAGSTAAYAGSDWNKFMSEWGPLIEKQMTTLTDGSMVKRAEADAARTPGLMAGATNRALQRRGGATTTQAAAMEANRQIGDPLAAVNTINNARIDQRSRNFDTALKLSGVGTDVYQMGLDNVRESEGLAAGRKANNAAASSAYKQNIIGGVMSAAAIAAMMM